MQPMQPMQQQIIEYKSESDMARGIRHMNAQGWQAVGAPAIKTSGPGCLRVFLFGPFAFLMKRRAHYLVTFSR